MEDLEKMREDASQKLFAKAISLYVNEELVNYYGLKDEEALC